MKVDAYSLQLMEWAKEVIAYLVASGIKPSDAEDVVQDVFVRMLEAEFVIPGDKLRAWMYRVALRRYIDIYRRDKRYHELIQLQFFRPEDLIVFDTEDYDWLRSEVARLKLDYRVVIELYYFQGFSIKEIAAIVGHSQSKVKMDLSRGRQALKQTLEKAGIIDGNI